MNNDISRFADFLKTNTREPKPRSTGITEIRGPYYSVVATFRSVTTSGIITSAQQMVLITCDYLPLLDKTEDWH